jgi:hypothetical protein
MASVADAFRTSLRQRLLALTPGERVDLTARLAASDLEIYCAAHGVSLDAAREHLARRRAAGRRPSCANAPRTPDGAASEGAGR